MKKLLIVNLVFAGLFVICFWFFALFTHGVFVNPVGLMVAGFLGWCVLTPMLPGALLLLVFDIYGVFKYWSKYKLITLLPFIVLGIAVVSLFTLDVRTMRIKRFEKYLPDYEAFVAKVEKEHTPGDLNSIDMPKEYKHLGYSATVNYYEPNNLYVLVTVGSGGGFGRATFFLYSSNGDIATQSEMYRIVHYKERLNAHWFIASN